MNIADRRTQKWHERTASSVKRFLGKLLTRGVAPKGPDPNLIYYDQSGKTREAHATWYRGENTNYHPRRASLAEPDAVEKYIGHGWFPPRPFIDKDRYITAFGSCFAREVTKFLFDEGYRVFGRDLNLNAYVVRSGEGIVNTAALRQQFEWALDEKRPLSELWHDKNGVAGDYSDEIQATTRDIFTSTEIFIFTLGLSEVWYDKETNEIFWRAVPKTQFDPERHAFRVLGVEENKENLKRVYELVRKHRPDAQIIMTLSPVPLAATFRPVSCVTANAVSKASLRVAIDEIMREFEGDERLHYFPSYEIVTCFFADPMKDDLRHPRREVVDFIMQTFKRHYLL